MAGRGGSYTGITKSNKEAKKGGPRRPPLTPLPGEVCQLSPPINILLEGENITEVSTDVRSAILTCNLQKLKGKLGGSGRARAGRWVGGEGGRPTPPHGMRVPQGCARGRGGRADAPLRTVARTAPSEPAAARWAAAGNLPGVVLGVVGAARGAWAPICLHSGAPPPPHPRHTEPHSEAERSGGRLRAPDLRPSSPASSPRPAAAKLRERRAGPAARARHTWARLSSAPPPRTPPVPAPPAHPHLSPSSSPPPSPPPPPPSSLRTWGGVLERRVTNAVTSRTPFGSPACSRAHTRPPPW